jgi:thiol-disulfide isomerase/thioredoxin
VAGALLLPLAGCWSDGAGRAQAVPGTCLNGSGPSSGPGAQPASAGAVRATAAAGTAVPATAAGAERMPEIGLACFDGSGTVQLGQLTGPAVVNLWASWCPPCVAELPAVQRLAERTAGRLAVIGVNTGDVRGAARDTIDELGLAFPMLVDDRRQLLAAVGKVAVPATLFVGADGRIVHVYNGRALDDAALDRLTAQYLGPATG